MQQLKADVMFAQPDILTSELNRIGAEMRATEARINEINQKHQSGPDYLYKSTHVFCDEIRNGLILDSIADQHVLDLIKQHKAHPSTEEYEPRSAGLDRNKPAAIDEIHSRLLYYYVASLAVLREFKLIDGLKPNWESFQNDAQRYHAPENYAFLLFAKCVSLGNSSADSTIFDYANDLMRASTLYHKMSLGLIERSAVNKIRQGAKKRSQDASHSYRRRNAMGIARQYIMKKQTTGRKWTYRDVTEYVKKHYVPELDEPSPALNTMINWLKNEDLKPE